MWEEIALWCVIIIATGVIEVQTISLTSIWFTISGIVSLILAICNVAFEVQAIVFIVLAAVLLAATRPFIKRFMDKSIIRTNTDKLVSMIGIVTLNIPAGEIGEIKVGSELWRAVSLDNDVIKVGEKVVVNSITGNKLLVSRVISENDVEII